VRIWSYAGWKHGTTYVALVRGGAQGVKSLIAGQQQPVVRSAYMELLSGSRPLCAFDFNL
jgi:hypothetical protein